MPEQKDYVVGIAQTKISKSPGKLIVYGIGSCVVLALYDIRKKIGGVAHILLPDSSCAPGDTSLPGKYADTAVAYLETMILDLGSSRYDMVAKLVGGAEMFPPFDDSCGKIGEKNIIATKKALESRKIRLTAEDTGGKKGRTAEFDLDTGLIKLTILGEQAREI